jgi:hypothetical protein
MVVIPSPIPVKGSGAVRLPRWIALVSRVRIFLDPRWVYRSSAEVLRNALLTQTDRVVVAHKPRFGRCQRDAVAHQMDGGLVGGARPDLSTGLRALSKARTIRRDSLA